MSRRAWVLTTLSLAGFALILAWIAGLEPAFTAISPQRLNVDFVDDHVANNSKWVIETGAPLPKAFRNVMPFSSAPENVSPLLRLPAYVASAGATRFSAPDAEIERIATGDGKLVTLTFRGSERANEMLLVVPKDSGLDRIEFEGKSFVPRPDAKNPLGTVFGCLTRDCRDKKVTLHFASQRPVEVSIGEIDYGLPDDGARLEAVRPDTTVASQSGDTTIVFGKLKLP